MLARNDYKHLYTTTNPNLKHRLAISHTTVQLTHSDKTTQPQLLLKSDTNIKNKYRSYLEITPITVSYPKPNSTLCYSSDLYGWYRWIFRNTNVRQATLAANRFTVPGRQSFLKSH